MIHLFKSAVAKLWLLLAALLMLVALGVVAARVFLPALSSYSDELESMAGDLLGVPVRLERVGARLRGFTPQLVLKEVELLNPETAQPAISFSGMRLGVDLLRSLANRELSFGEITLFGARLALRRRADGSIELQGLNVHSKPVDWERVAALFHRKGRLRVIESELLWENETLGAGPLQFEDIDLEVVNNGPGYRLHGRLRIQGAEGAWLQVSMELQEDEETDGNWVANARLQGRQLPLKEMSRGWPAADFAVGAGRLDLDLRLRLDQRNLQRIGGSMAVSGLELSDPQGVRSWGLERLQADADWRRRPSGWDLEARNLMISRGDRDWPSSDFALRFDKAGTQGRRLVAGFEFLRLDDIVAALRLSPFAEDSIGEALTRLRPGGDVRDLQLRLSFAEGGPFWAARGRVEDFHSEVWGRAPSLEGFDLRFWADQHQGTMELDSTGAQVRFAELFRGPLVLDSLRGRLDWHRKEAGPWVVKSDLVVADTPHIKTRSRFLLKLPPDGRAPFLDLQTDFRNGDAAGTPHYLPVGIMSSGLVAWLDRAIVSGRVGSGSALVRGDLADFPFSNHEGRFEVLFGTEDLVLDYQEGWPRLEGIVAETRFLNNSVSIHAEAGYLLESRLEEARVDIQVLHPTRPLEVSGSVRGPFRDGMRMLRETPLAERFGALAQLLRANGESRVQLEMSMPLHHLDATRVTGNISWRDAGLYAADLDLQLSNMSGSMRFTQDGVTASGIQAVALGAPITIEVEGLPGVGGTRTLLSGELPVSALAERYPGGGLEYLSGAANWTFAIDIPLPRDGRLPPRRVEVVSDLRGIGVALPAPFGKPPAEGRPLRLLGELSDRPMKRFDIRYGSQIDAALVVETEPGGNGALQRCQVRFGGGKAELWPGEGLQLVGSLERLDLDPWLNVRPPDGAGAGMAAEGLLRGIDLEIGELRLGGRSFDRIELSLRHSEAAGAAWLGTLKTSRMAGNIYLPLDTEREPLALKFSYLDLELDGGEEDPATEAPAALLVEARDPRRFSGLDLSIEELRVDGEPVGRLELRANKAADGLVVDNLSFRGPDLELDAQGSWLADDRGTRSRLKLTANSANPGQLIRRFGFDNYIETGSAGLTANLEWPGGPLPADLRDLQGDFRIQLGQGRFLEADPGIGRVFGLLSLGALQRRLSLDFTDMFGKGFAFDRIEGSFLLDEGNAYTTDSYLEGPSTRLDIAGRTGLVARDYEQYVTVTPRMSTSIPVAAALAVSPPVGAAVLVAQQLVGKELDKITRFRYEVLGPWDDPQITFVRVGAATTAGGGFLDSED